MVRKGPKRTAAAIGEVNRQQATEISSSKRSRKKSIEKPTSEGFATPKMGVRLKNHS